MRARAAPGGPTRPSFSRSIARFLLSNNAIFRSSFSITPVHLASDEDGETSDVQLKHEDHDRAERTIGCTVAVEEVEI